MKLTENPITHTREEMKLSLAYIDSKINKEK